MLDIRPIDSRFAVAPQIAPEDAAEIRAAGYVLVINNRPDDEAPGQPTGEAVEAACRAVGLDYLAVPVDHHGFRLDQVTATLDAIAAANGPILAYCRSGTRSCHLWALASAGMGVPVDDLIVQAGGAGYDLAGARPLLQSVAAGA
ncbi:TIGR01244 family sulfur transferase [Sphingomonas sp.]|jgi:uncharacterized protein (TIGR01244 family)|uniref:TIGR01244 family sulfur transferase n=1 Tax=Sphingomonas sp. TaxID=28214 RepID=UPI0035C809D3